MNGNGDSRLAVTGELTSGLSNLSLQAIDVHVILIYIPPTNSRSEDETERLASTGGG